VSQFLSIKERYFIKIVPQRGDVVHRFEVTRKHIVTGSIALAVALLVVLSGAGFQVFRVHAQQAALQSQHEQLQTLDKKASAIRSQLQQVQRQNQEIQQLIGVGSKPRPHSGGVQKTSWVPASGVKSGVVQLARHVDQLAQASNETLRQANALRRLTMHVLNMHHLAELARARMLAAIPSIDPVDGAQIVGCFCYRSAPDVEFHSGVDLGANYGDSIHAAAAGTIASAGWDGGFGMKVDIDHGNGYHTWYAHLSRTDVSAGQYVHKGEFIGLVGDSGFSTGAHLHYQVMLNGTPVDPAPYLNGVPPQVLASLP
jgi:murein DD-endopeptidase MepM/ murein hydrolase activator NlpD